ncbi:MAG: type II toxin-antitoxin system VapC family toxin [Propionibacteriaceae bacterium]|jgi:predicted nucleic acid-binding protein|nr:type II toxin-antitoxin system VapC family toxin [Propionibacteriaceae bacterium]
MIVVDASVAVAWCFEDESTPATDQILARVAAEGATVPPLWCYEVANALLTARRRQRLAEADAQRFLALLDRLPIEPEPAAPDATALLATAQAHGLSAYAAAYLLLAQRLGLELATLDSALAQAARDSGVTVIP